MNYFQILDLPESIEVDREELLRKYLEINKNLGGKTSPVDPSIINIAYRTLYDKFERLKYFLEIKGISFDKDDIRIADEFLEEVAEYRFKMSSASDINERDRIRKKVEEKMDFLFYQMTGALQKGEKDLIVSIFVKIKYLSKIISEEKK